MKKLMSLLIVLAASNVLASQGIDNSTLSLRHQEKIEQAILKNCANLNRYALVELNNSVELDHVDNGITDQYHTTTLKISSRLDQLNDESIVTVKSSISSGYDHGDKEWGIISAGSVQGCQ